MITHRNRSFSIFLTALILFCYKLILPQNQNIRNYNVQDGLPHQDIMCGIQDTTGRLWFSLFNGGLCIYDGSSWETLSEEDGVPKVTYKKLFLCSKGILWAMPPISKDKIVFLDKNNWKHISFPEKEFSDVGLTSISVKYTKNDTILTLGTINHGIIQYKNRNWLYPQYNKDLIGETVFNLEEKGDSLFVLTNRGMLLVVNNIITYFKKLYSNMPDEKIIAFNVQKFKPTNIIWLLADNWLGYIKNNKFSLLSSTFTFPYSLNYLSTFVLPADNNKIYYGNVKDLYIFDKINQTNIRLGTENGFNTRGASWAFIDREKNIWFTTKRGISKLQRSSFTNYYRSDGLLQNEVTAIEKLDDKTLILGHNNGFTLFKNKGFYRLKFDLERMPDSRVLDFTKDTKNNVWFAARELGIGKINTDLNIDWFNNNKNLHFNTVRIDREGTLIIGTNRGLYMLRNKKIIRYPLAQEFHPNIRKIYFLDNQVIALTTVRDGLIFISKNKTKFINNKSKEINSVYCLYKSDNELFVGTLYGLYVVEEESLVKYKSNNFQINVPIYFITKDKKNNIWFGTNDGLIKWDGIRSRKYSVSEGLSGPETNRSASYVDDDGKFWIGTNKGLSCLNPNYDYAVSVKPKQEFLSLETASGERFKLNNPVELSYTQNNILFHYRGLSFIDENSLRYHVEIKDIDNGWSNKFITSENVARFTNLNPGRYTVSLVTENPKTTFSDSLFTPIVTINKPFFNQWWFYLINFLIASSIIYSVQNYISQKKYSSRLEKEVLERTKLLSKSEENIRMLTQELFRAQENERKRIAMDLHDNVAQEISALKIFISKFASLHSDANTKKINTLLERSISSIREILYDLRPVELDQLGLVKSLYKLSKKFSKETNIKLKFFSSGFNNVTFNPDAEINIFRLFQEILNNIRKHAKAKKVKINLIASYPNFLMCIEDDGVGFNVEEKTIEAVKNKRMGLQTIKERTYLLNGKLKIDSTPGKGTKFKIEISLKDQNED